MPTYTRETIPLYDATPDLIPQESPPGVWNNAKNVIFSNGETSRARTVSPVMGAAQTPPRALAFHVTIAGEFRWVYAGLGGIFATDGVTHWDITPAVWSPAAPATWMAFSWNGVVVIHTSSTDPVYWDGVDVNICVPLPGWPAGWRFHAMRPFGSFLFAIGQLDSAGPQRVAWSDAAEAGAVPLEWTATDENLAGFVDLATGESACLDAATIRNTLLIFKGEAVFSADLVGGNAVFQFRSVFNGTGIIAPNAWAEGPNDQILFASSDGDMLRTDGNTWESILARKFQRTYYSQLSGVPFYGFAGATLGRARLSMMAFPLEGETDTASEAVIFNWDDGAVGYQELPAIRCAAGGRLLNDPGAENEWNGDPAAWNTDASPWSYSISAATNDDVICGNDGGLNTFEGAPALPIALEALGIAFGDAQRRKLIGRVWPNILGNEGDVVRVRVGGSETVAGNTQWAPAVNWVIGSGLPVDTFVEGRYLNIQLTADTGQAWRMGSLDLEFKGAGTW